MKTSVFVDNLLVRRKHMKEERLSQKQVFECSFMKLYVDKVKLDNGIQSERVYIKHPGAAAVFPITKDGNIILIKQYRYPIQSITIEIPAGKTDDKELGIVCAQRELEEETGFSSKNIKHVMNIHNCLGYSDELIELFVASNCEPLNSPKKMDDDEQIEILIVTIKEALELLKNGHISDAKTIIMLQWYALTQNISF
jgi:ADP-ribose pyrophosphatase